jgi:hypothetical protein
LVVVTAAAMDVVMGVTVVAALMIMVAVVI